jgi:regulator of sirC expression with transglutaminase-like and TPR domain
MTNTRPPGTSEPDYSCDTEFSKLLARRSDVDLTVLGLEIARDAYPDLQFGDTLRWVHQRATALREPFAAATREREALALLADELGHRQGLTGSDAAYDHPDGSYLNRVVATGVGIPISLSLVYMAVATRAGLPLEGVSTPQHFLTRCEAAEGPLFLDAYTPGHVMTEDECLDWLVDLTSMTEDQIRPSLEPAGPRAVVVRVLNNLKVVHAKREDWEPAWRVQHRLSALQPGSYHERRDLGILALHADKPAHAIDLLRACLRTCPDNEREVLQNHLELARSKQARWN